MTPIRVLVASQWPLLRLSLRAVVDGARDMELAAASGDWADTVDQVRRHGPDVVVAACLLDGQRQAIMALRKIERRLDARTVVVGLADPPAPVWWMLIAGVSGFVTLDQPPEEVLRAVRATAAGSSLYSATVSPIATALSWGERPDWASLSAREVEVVRLAARGCTDAEVAHEMGVTAVTVRKHTSRALRKLGCADRVELVARLFAAGVLDATDVVSRVPAA